MQEATLPDCEEYEFRLNLTAEEEEELLQEIAEKGKKGLDEFSSRYSDKLASGRLGEKLKRYRERLEEQASRMLERKERELEDREERKHREMFREIEDFRKVRPQLLPDMDRINLIDLEDLMGRDDLLKHIRDEGPDTLWDRIKGFLLRTYIWMLSVVQRIRSFFKRRKMKGAKVLKKKKKKMSLAIFGGKFRFNIGVPVSELLKRPGIRKKIMKELRRSGEYSAEEFEVQAEKLLEQHMEATVKRELEREQEETEDEIRKMEQKEEDLQDDMKRELEKEKRFRDMEIRKLRAELLEKTEDPVKRMLERNLIELGFIQQDGEEILPTTSLLERFADLIFQKELNAISGTGTRMGHSEKKLGIYEKYKMRSVYEESRMDLVTTLVNTRINHPGDRHIYEEDIIVYREESAISSHVVIMFDRSSSMDENHRMDAAKRTVMALYRAVRRQKEKDRIDIIGFDTKVSLMDLMSVWNTSPRGFTNIAGALRTARILFEDSRADLQIAYLITDGLPEAYTNDKGKDIAGEPDICMEHALREAKGLNAHLTMILLEPRDETYVMAGKKIVNEANGKLIITNPQELMHEVLADYLG